MKKRIVKRLSRELFSRLFIDSGSDKDAIFVAGAGRSGTTWLTDNIAQLYNFRLVFEPFWHLHLKKNEIEDFFHHRYIEQNDDNYDEEIKYVLGASYKNYKTNLNYKVGPYNGRIIKDICANLFLKRIRGLYPQLPIIFVIRNPYSVISSRLKKGEWSNPWGFHAHLFNEQKPLLEACDLETKIVPKNELEDHTISYCYENYLPLKWKINNDQLFHLVTYENYLKDPINEIRKITEYIDTISNLKRVKKLADIEEKYLMASTKSQHKITANKESQINKWKKDFDDAELQAVNKILDDFKMLNLFEKIGLKEYV